jgi:hypothetical protein
MLEYNTETMQWRGLPVEVRYCPDWTTIYRDIYGYALGHLEIQCPRRPLPITETGYLSRFERAENIDAEGGPLAYVRAWLDQAAGKPEWKAREVAAQQLSLF